jgi:hypothetical protein
MKRLLIILIGGLLVGGAGYCLFYFPSAAAHRKMFEGNSPELLWLQKEFNLSEAELSRVTQLHEAYLPQCKERCRHIEEVNRKLTETINSASEMSPEIETLLTQRAKLRAECQAEMLKHFFAVSRTMPTEQGRRYLAWVRERTCLDEGAMNHGEEMESSHHQ